MYSWSHPFEIGRLAVVLALLLQTNHPVLASKNEKNDPSASFPKYMEPEVMRYPGLIPPDVCQKLIALGEETGFPLEFDSIDDGAVEANNVSQAIDVINEDGTVNHPKMYDLLAPYIPKMAEIIRKQRNAELHRQIFDDDRLPDLGWVFFRKYSPESPRNSLFPHYDFNLHSVILALNDDYEGGGLFIVKPEYKNNPDWMIPGNEDNLYKGRDRRGIPDISQHQMSYDWVNTRNRVNTTDVIFPLLNQGDVVVHNYTVFHGVAPVKEGSRYSIAFFFDMDNPMIEPPNFGKYDRRDGEDGDGKEDDDDYMDITLKHEIKECNLATGKLEYIKDSIDIIWVSPEQLEKEKRENKRDNIMLMEDAFLDEGVMVAVESLLPGVIDKNERSISDQVYRAVLPFFKDEENDSDNGDNEDDARPLDDYWEVLAEIRVVEGKKDYEFISSMTEEECMAASTAAGSTSDTTSQGRTATDEL